VAETVWSRGHVAPEPRPQAGQNKLETKPKILVVGAFPPPNSLIVGGIVTTCKGLLAPKFSNQFILTLIDSTQRSNPPPIFLLRFVFAMRRIIKYIIKLLVKQPDAVLLFTSLNASVAEKGLMAWLARLKRTPVLLFPRGAELISVVQKNFWQRMWIKPAMRGATYLLCQGPAWQRFAVSDLGFNLERTKIIQNWTATPELLQVGHQRVRSANLARTKILFLGWLEKEKGIFQLLEACKILSHHHNFVLTIAGRGSGEAQARSYVNENNLEHSVEFAGWVHNREKIQLLANADILVLPSWAEGFPNAIIEAMAAKVAVIVTSVGNVPDMLQHRQQALIIPPKDVNSLSFSLCELLENSHFRWQLAERGFIYAQEHFSSKKVIEQLAAFIKTSIT